MIDKITQIVDRSKELERQMAMPEVLADHTKLTELAQEHSNLADIVAVYHRYKNLQQQLGEAEEMIELSDDDEMKELALEEKDQLNGELAELDQQILSLLIPKDPRDNKNVYIEIRAGAGGDEAGLFASDLMRLYTRYAELRRWKVELVDENPTGVGGYKEVILSVKGRGAYSRFKFESGVHRVQRVPITESQGRIHTSTITVAVMPEIEDVEITLDERDLEITATFSSGPGGQHMQKNATACRVVHKPSGLMVKVQTERSLTQNKRVALGIIQGRLQEMEEDKQAAEIAADRKSQVGTGERSEKIRTYNYPQGRVTDHRVGFHSYNLPAVMEGDLDPFIDALTVADEAARLATVTGDE